MAANGITNHTAANSSHNHVVFQLFTSTVPDSQWTGMLFASDLCLKSTTFHVLDLQIEIIRRRSSSNVKKNIPVATFSKIENKEFSVSVKHRTAFRA